MVTIESIAIGIQSVMDRFLTKVGKCPNCTDGQLMVWKSPNRDGELRCAPTCPNCGFSERLAPNTTLSDIDATIMAAKNSAKGYLHNNSIVSTKVIFEYTMKSYITDNKAEEAAKMFAAGIVDRITTGQKVHATLIGGPGRGKTHLAMAICYQALARTNYRLKVAFIDWRELLDIVKSGMHKNNDDIQAYGDSLINEFGKADIVVMDDLGAERGTEYEQYLTDRFWRLREDKTVITTTNLTASELKDSYSDRMISRMQKYSDKASFVMAGINDHRKNIGGF